MSKHELIQNIFSTFPAMMKKMMGQISCTDMPKQQFMLLHAIRHHDSMPMGYYSEKLMISKPNMTVLADKLIEAGYVERYMEPGDRRVINLRTTAEGREYADKAFTKVHGHIIRKFENVDESVLYRMNELVKELYQIIEELDKEQEDRTHE